MDRRIVRWGIPLVLSATLAIGVTTGAKSAPTKNQTQTTQNSKSLPPAQAIQWSHDLQKARRTSVSTGRPMLIVFGGKRCVYCKKLDAEVFNNAVLANYINKKFIPVHLDFEKNRRSAEILEVQSLPTSVILSADADLLGSVEGYVDVRRFADVLHQSIEYQRTLREDRAVAVQESH